jgi:two-component system, sensor histidine kinase YesM
MLKKWTQINNLPIRVKLISHFLLISILPIICLGLLVSWTVERVLEEDANENTQQIISKVNETFEFYISNMQSITYMIAFDDDIKDFLSTGNKDNKYDMQQFLRNFTTISSEIAGILIVNKDGEYISNELYASPIIDLTETDWYEAAVQNNGIFHIIGRPDGRRLLSIVDYKNEDVVTVVRSVVNPFTNEVEGVILIDLKLRVIAESAKNVRLGKNGYLMVMDKTGENIYQPANSIINHIPMEWFDDTSSGNFVKEVNDENVQFIYQRSSFANWITVGVFPQRDTLFELKEINFYLVVFIFLIMLFGIPVSYYLSYTISKPIVQLMSFMQFVEKGNFQVRYNEKRLDEIGLLGRSFNKMIIRINELMHLAERQERQKREAEFRSLQANINPHFLYNTLDTIQWMARKQKALDVAEIVSALAKLFRIGLSKGRDMITVEEEIAHIDSYLAIQKVRYRDKLLYTVKLDDTVKKWYTLKFILQPIIENAIYHGIKEKRGQGIIEIIVEEKDSCIVMIVRDNGAGMSIEQLEEMRISLAEAIVRTEKADEIRNKKGYGLLNVQARIQLTYGKAYGMHIDSELGEGTIVTIRLPKLVDNQQPRGGEL